MPEEAFKLMVIFFGLTKSLAAFQAMINSLLRDIIEAEDIVVFIDNMMVRIEIKEWHDEIVEEVLRKMVENNLFVKLEKYIQKVREVRFLEVIIGPDSIRIEKEKVQKVVDWLMSKSMKNVQKFLGLVNYYKQFVKDFARVAKLLYEMMRKDVKQNQRKDNRKYLRS